MQSRSLRSPVTDARLAAHEYTGRCRAAGPAGAGAGVHGRRLVDEKIAHAASCWPLLLLAVAGARLVASARRAAEHRPDQGRLGRRRRRDLQRRRRPQRAGHRARRPRLHDVQRHRGRAGRLPRLHRRHAAARIRTRRPADTSTSTPGASATPSEQGDARRAQSRDARMSLRHAPQSPTPADSPSAQRAGALSRAQRHRVGPGQVPPRRRAVALRRVPTRPGVVVVGGHPAPAPLGVAGAARHQVSYRSDPLRYSLTCSPSPSAMVMMRHAISSTLVSW